MKNQAWWVRRDGVDFKALAWSREEVKEVACYILSIGGTVSWEPLTKQELEEVLR